jgi:hypothetical protein
MISHTVIEAFVRIRVVFAALKLVILEKQNQE